MTKLYNPDSASDISDKSTNRLLDLYHKILGKFRQKTPVIVILIFGCLFIFYILQDISLNNFQSSSSSLNVQKLIKYINYKKLKGIISNEEYNLSTHLNSFWDWLRNENTKKFQISPNNTNKLSIDDIKQNKIIVLWTHFFNSPTWYFQNIGVTFKGCKYKSCKLTIDKTYANQADALLIHYRNLPYFYSLPKVHPKNQIWIFFLVESPPHTCDFQAWSSYCNLKSYDGIFNWTGTYMSHSDIVVPYVSYHKLSPAAKRRLSLSRGSSLANGSTHNNMTVTNFAMGKTKLAATFISNCNTNNHRLDFIEELGSYLTNDPFDIYGECGGRKVCPDRSTQCETDLLNPYKFYLAFENSNCVEYITEKVHRALSLGLVPVVYGARYVDYVAHLPPGSFVYVSSPLNERHSLAPGEDLQNISHASPYHPYFGTSNLRDLAAYLKRLDSNDTLYNAYHEWRSTYATGSGPNTETYMCQICRHLHLGDIPPKSYQISQWWNKDSACAV